MVLYCAIILLLKVLSLLCLVLVLLIAIGRLFVEPVNGICKCTTNLDGKIALVTGGNSGIGLETVRNLASRGARVIIACRDEKKARDAIKDIENTTGKSKIEYRYLDLFKPSCIRKFADDFNRSFDRLHILVNNAGCSGVAPKIAENGVELTMQVNYIGPFLLTNLLMDKMIASKPSRIVIVSSKLHRIAYFNVEDLAGVKTIGHLFRYSNSKFCNVLWTQALAMRLSEGVTVNSLHPGFVKTGLFKPLGLYGKIMEAIAGLFFKMPKDGAQTVLHLCVAPELKYSSGGYYSECRLRDYHKKVQDKELIQKVWIESMRFSEK